MNNSIFPTEVFKKGSEPFLVPFPKKFSLFLFFTWALIPSTLAQAESKKIYKEKTYVNFDEALVEGKGRNPYSSYLFKKKEALVNDLSQWKPDWKTKIRKSRAKLK